MKLIDLNHTFFDSMPVFPGDESPELNQVCFVNREGHNSFKLTSSLHAGTHMDAPLHMMKEGKFISEFPVELFSSNALLIDVSQTQEIDFDENWISWISGHEAILFRTLQSEKWGTEAYYGDFPVFSENIAARLKELNIRIVGFDSPSPDREPYLFHKIFLDDETFMIENLTNLDQIPEKTTFRLYSFPLKINAEASLIRAVAELS